MDIAQGERGGNAPMDAAPKIIPEWELNRREILRVEIHEFKGTQIIGVRKWFRTADGELAPGKDGINLSLKHLPRLASAVAEALAVVQADGLIQGEGVE